MARNGWKDTTLGDVCEVIRRGKQPKYVEYGLAVVNQKCVRNDRVLQTEHLRFTDIEQVNVPEVLYLRNGDVLVNSTGTGTVGRSALIEGLDGDLTLDSHVTLLRPNPELVLGDYLFADVLMKEQDLINAATGSTNQVELSARAIKALPVQLPSIEEQREIVNFVQAIDNLIQAGDREISSAEQMRGDALKTVLTDRNSQWEQIPLREVATWKSGATPKAGTPEFYQGGTINWAKIGDIRNAPIYDTDTKITKAGFEKIKKVAPVGSTLIAMYGSIGRSAFVMNEMATNQAILCGIPDEEVIVPEFLFLSALNLEDEFHRQGRGAAQPNINKTIIGDQKIPLPPLEEQEKIVEKMQALDAYLESAKRSQEALKQVRKDALHALLSGDKDVRELAEMFSSVQEVA
ncbi:restriction endonuclease subunit S [Corynebacterium durum]